MRLLTPITAAFLLAVTALQPLAARESAGHTVPAHGVIGVEDAMLDPAFWVKRLPDAERVVLDREAIATQNARLLKLDRSMHDLEALPPKLDRERVAGWVTGLSKRPGLFEVALVGPLLFQGRPEPGSAGGWRGERMVRHLVENQVVGGVTEGGRGRGR